MPKVAEAVELRADLADLPADQFVVVDELVLDPDGFPVGSPGMVSEKCRLPGIGIPDS